MASLLLYSLTVPPPCSGVGLCIQRAALSVAQDVIAPGCGGKCCKSHHKINWFLGLSVYGAHFSCRGRPLSSSSSLCNPAPHLYDTLALAAIGGLGLGTVALSYVTLATTTALFSSCLIFNAIIARYWLSEKVTWVDLFCYAVIAAGIALAAVCLPKDTNIYGVVPTCALLFTPPLPRPPPPLLSQFHPARPHDV